MPEHSDHPNQSNIDISPDSIVSPANRQEFGDMTSIEELDIVINSQIDTEQIDTEQHIEDLLNDTSLLDEPEYDNNTGIHSADINPNSRQDIPLLVDEFADTSKHQGQFQTAMAEKTPPPSQRADPIPVLNHEIDTQFESEKMPSEKTPVEFSPSDNSLFDLPSLDDDTIKISIDDVAAALDNIDHTSSELNVLETLMSSEEEDSISQSLQSADIILTPELVSDTETYPPMSTFDAMNEPAPTLPDASREPNLSTNTPALEDDNATQNLTTSNTPPATVENEAIPVDSTAINSAIVNPENTPLTSQGPTMNNDSDTMNKPSNPQPHSSGLHAQLSQKIDQLLTDATSSLTHELYDQLPVRLETILMDTIDTVLPPLFEQFTQDLHTAMQNNIKQQLPQVIDDIVGKTG